jgi:uncharacterized caspase-like protein
MDAPNGTFIAYSTAPGSVAEDGMGTNSPFVAALLQNIVRPGEPIEAIFRNVRRTVLDVTEGYQRPWDASSLIAPFYFGETSGATTSATVEVPVSDLTPGPPATRLLRMDDAQALSPLPPPPPRKACANPELCIRPM